MQLALEIKNLTKSYGDKTAVDDISFFINRGEFFGFLGPNGAGKTSTISAIIGTAKFNSGSIRVFGHDVVEDYREARKCIGVSPQEFNVDFFGTPRKILYFVGGYFGIPKKERLARIDEIFSMLGLESYADTPFRALSGGFKRRLMLARALIHNPDLLILDEPTAGVDVELRHDLWKILTELNKNGKTIFLTTHYLEEAEKLCDRIGIIFGGKIVSMESKIELLKNAKSVEEHYLTFADLRR